MSMQVWLVYLMTVLAFMCIPGPSHILMLSNSLTNGFQRATATAVGDLSANFLQMLAAAVGLASLLQSSQNYFVAIKWAGVAYLIYAGIRLFFAKHSPIKSASQRSAPSLYWQGFITSAANPKAIIFFAALFPQFLSQSQPLAAQFFILSITYLTIDGLFLCGYGRVADFLAAKYRSHLGHYFNQMSGSLFVLAAFLLAIKNVASK